MGVMFALLVFWAPHTKGEDGVYPLYFYAVILLAYALHQVLYFYAAILLAYALHQVTL